MIPRRRVGRASRPAACSLVIIGAIGCGPPPATPSPRAGEVVINELAWQLANNAEFVEIMNATDFDQVLDELVLHDEGGNSVALTGVLPLKQRIVLDKGTAYTTFGWRQGEGATLVDASGLVVDALPAQSVARNTTWGRFPDATGDHTVLVPTRGEPNEVLQ